MDSVSHGKFITMNGNGAEGEDEEVREGVLVLLQDGVWIQRYFTIFESRIFFSFRGREKSHYFSPLTIATPMESMFSENHYTFKVETDDQPPFTMAAPTRTDLDDWIGAIRSDVIKLVNNVMQPYLMKGFGTIEKKALAVPVEEGCFASFAFRKQGSQIVPIFLTLESNKLTCYRASREKEKVGKWDITKETSVEILENYAAPTFKVDKEILVVDSISTRANWILSLKQSMERSKVQGRSKSLIDFGAPQVVPPGTMRINSVDDNSAENFYKTFAGSVRISGTIRMDPQTDFSTMQINDTIDDGQDKFLNLKFELEDDDEDDDLSAVDAGMITPLNSSSDNIAMASSSSEENVGKPDNPLLLAFIPPSAMEDDAPKPDKNIIIKRNRRMTKTTNGPGGPGIVRLKLKSKLPEGPIKVYGGALNSQEPYKAIVISSETTTVETIALLLGKYNIPKEHADQYILVEEEMGGQNISRVLDEYESPLIVKLNWDHRNVRFAIYLKTTTLQNAALSNYFVVRCMDGSGTTVKFNEHLSVSRICELTGRNINLQKSSLSCFSLWLVSDDFELQLEPTQQFRIIAQDWPQLRKRFLPDAASDKEYQIIYRRWAFLALAAERRCKDPGAIQLLYEQARLLIVQGSYPCNETDAITLAGLSAKLTFGPYDESVHVPGYLIKNTDGLKSIVSPYLMRQTSFNSHEFEAKVYQEYAKHNEKVDMICHLLYLQVARQWSYYGSTFFQAKLLTTQLVGKGSKRTTYIEENKNRAILVRIGVSVETLSIIDVLRNSVLFSQDLDSINVISDFGSNCFAFESRRIRNDGVNTTTDKDLTLYALFTTQASLIENFVTSCKRQRIEDELALKALRNMQRPRSKTDASQRSPYQHSRSNSG